MPQAGFKRCRDRARRDLRGRFRRGRTAPCHCHLSRSGATGPIQGEEIKNAIGILTLRLQRHQPQTSVCTYPGGPYNQERAEQIAKEIQRKCPTQVVSNGDGFDVQWEEIDEPPGGMTRTFGNAVKKVAAQKNQEQRQSEEWRKRREEERAASLAVWEEAGRPGYGRRDGPRSRLGSGTRRYPARLIQD